MLLLVDDDLEQLEMRQRILAGEGFTVATAATAGQALEQCQGCRAVVLDLRLPALRDGLGLIRDLHSRVPEAALVVLAGLPEELNGQPESALVHRVLRKGAGSAAIVQLLRSMMD
jgi:CheY-like chemotaxis protein